MFSVDTIQGRAFRAAGELPQDVIEEEADRLACAAALGVNLSPQREDWWLEYGALIQSGAPFDERKWRSVYWLEKRARLYPEAWIERWIAEAWPGGTTQTVRRGAPAIASICEGYFSDRRSDGYFAKAVSPVIRVDGRQSFKSVLATSKAEGLGNAEVRHQLERGAQAAIELAAALHSIRNEALRPGQARSVRGTVMRELYLSPFAAMIEELSRDLVEDEAGQLTPIAPHIGLTDSGYDYSDMNLPWESALTAFARRLARSAANDQWWKALPSAHTSKRDARRNLVQSLGRVWIDITSDEPTFTQEPSRSPFLKLLSACLGHMAGLVTFRSLTDRDRDNRLRRHGLERVHTARTYKTDYHHRK